MNKILLIIRREYLSRVKKRSFLIMTFLTPLFFAGMYAGAIWLAINGEEMNDKKIITVIDESGQFNGKIEDSKTLLFQYSAEDLSEVKKKFKDSEASYILYIPSINEGAPKGIELISEKQPSMSVVSYVEKEIQKVIENEKLLASGINKEMLENLKVDITIDTKRLTDEGEEEGNTGASYAIGFGAAFLIYMFIFLYGVQVMRGVIEEKNNRIVEVIISSVKPFQLMMGKIIGIAMVGLTQFLLWIFLTLAISGFVTSKVAGDNAKKFEQMQQSQTMGADDEMKNDFKEDGITNVIKAINTINFPLVIGTFIFYFLGGYLLYSALFAAVGSAVDNESETQQFMFPITIPLIFAFILSTSVVVNNPDGPLAFWLSIIPLTSPVVMMVRIPFGVPAWQLITSMIMLVLGFIGTVWIAGRIYRTGILMYGKKVNFRELGKWLFYKG
jgi:ABC-2 type transport system permease protein